MENLKVEVKKVTKITGEVIHHITVNGKHFESKIDQIEAVKIAKGIEEKYKEFGGLEKEEIVYTSAK